MSEFIRITIDGKECLAKDGQYLVEVARENGIYIPTLCNYEGIKPKGACRICTCKVNGRLMTACTTAVSNGMVIQSLIPEIEELRKAIIELFFAEGNHFCPACQKSGFCELQALAYRYRVSAPRYPLLFPRKRIDASHPLLIIDHNRCILCKRCVRGIKDENDRSYFAYRRRGQHIEVCLDNKLAQNMDENTARRAEDICPVGSILIKQPDFKIPIGLRKFDKLPIGGDIEISTK
jgi:[NiFe] hydrogenase diaphorase moiety small subunit